MSQDYVVLKCEFCVNLPSFRNISDRIVCEEHEFTTSFTGDSSTMVDEDFIMVEQFEDLGKIEKEQEKDASSKFIDDLIDELMSEFAFESIEEYLGDFEYMADLSPPPKFLLDPTRSKVFF